VTRQNRVDWIIDRWRLQGFVVMPDGSRCAISFATYAGTVEGVAYYGARFDTASPHEIWYVIFTDTNDLEITKDQAAYCSKVEDNVLLVSLQDPRVKRVLQHICRALRSQL
jgi:hypothetical protein